MTIQVVQENFPFVDRCVLCVHGQRYFCAVDACTGKADFSKGYWNAKTLMGNHVFFRDN